MLKIKELKEYLDTNFENGKGDVMINFIDSHTKKSLCEDGILGTDVTIDFRESDDIRLVLAVEILINSTIIQGCKYNPFSIPSSLEKIGKLDILEKI